MFSGVLFYSCRAAILFSCVFLGHPHVRETILFAEPTTLKTTPSQLDYLTGKYRASRHPGYKKIHRHFSDAAPHYLLAEAAEAFEKMAAAAANDKVSLKIVSGFRSFVRQKQIWEDKFLGIRLVNSKNLAQVFPDTPEKRVIQILLYSAAPGTSRHHWGTDLDINSVWPEDFESPEGRKVHLWLKENAYHFGFFQPYTAGRSGGYQEEKWHWSYKPISEKILIEFQTHITRKHLTGFKGAESLPRDFFQEYVLGINHDYSGE